MSSTLEKIEELQNFKSVVVFYKPKLIKRIFKNNGLEKLIVL